MNISKVLDDAKEKLNISSDYALAKATKIKKEYISMYRKGDRTPDAYACARLEEVLKLKPYELLSQMKAETEKNEEKRDYWKKVSERIASGAVAGFFVIVAGSATKEVEARTSNNVLTYENSKVLSYAFQELTVFRSKLKSMLTRIFNARMTYNF